MTDVEQRLADLQTQITLNQRLYEQQHESERKATETALAALTAKLMTMNDVRGALADQTRAMIPRVEVAAAIDALKERGDASREALWKRVESTIQPLDTKIDELHRPNVQLLISLAVLGMTLFGGLWVVLGLQISDHATPMALAIEQLKSQNVAQDTRTTSLTMVREAQLKDIESRLASERDGLTAASLMMTSSKALLETTNERVSALERAVSSGRAARAGNEATMAQKLVEVETQIAAIEVVINLMKDDNHQLFGLLWSKAFPNVTLPSKNYRPNLHKEVR